MTKPIKPQNVTLGPASSWDTVALGWDDGTNRYHVWVKLPDLRYARQETIYKNPPLGVKPGEPGYFEARKLDSSSKTWKPVLAAILAEARERHLVEAWHEQEAQKRYEQMLANVAAQKSHRLCETAPEMFGLLVEIEADLTLMGAVGNPLKRIRELIARVEG